MPKPENKVLPSKIEHIKYAFTHPSHRTSDQLKIAELIDVVNFLLESIKEENRYSTGIKQVNTIPDDKLIISGDVTSTFTDKDLVYMAEDWRVEFDKIVDSVSQSTDFDNAIYETTRNEIKAFIENLISKTKEEERERMKKIVKSLEKNYAVYDITAQVQIPPDVYKVGYNHALDDLLSALDE